MPLIHGLIEVGLNDGPLSRERRTNATASALRSSAARHGFGAEIINHRRSASTSAKSCRSNGLTCVYRPERMDDARRPTRTA